eukprot:gnl/TRDRNA2_/TRDRNA2_179281_c0_seq1.p1 gnl/TRDRNA2_/TRDRNA2_179281_c0~~gnl/TRDRNA2_/TRDRNA2_179281_c0_seq1.p1  ORF type:complete len:139 (+),score=21.95 gnl/TRDRNA2_/TRDRNA2_179281_c0_seq1:136-552(+)
MSNYSQFSVVAVLILSLALLGAETQTGREFLVKRMAQFRWEREASLKSSGDSLGADDLTAGQTTKRIGVELPWKAFGHGFGEGPANSVEDQWKRLERKEPKEYSVGSLAGLGREMLQVSKTGEVSFAQGAGAAAAQRR